MPPNPQPTARPHDLKVGIIKRNPEWDAPARKRHHIFLFDGTWNDRTGINPADFSWDDVRQVWVSRTDAAKVYPPIVTNVVKTHAALAADGPTQLTHYFRGVGNDDEHDAANVLSEGATARYEPFIRHLAYCQFIENFRRGDELSILGFSRGAASARLFARDIAQHGFVSELMIASRYVKARLTGDLRREVWEIWPKQSKVLVPGNEVPIAFLGLWDTVATSVSARTGDWAVPANVRRAVHCVALDEFRTLFSPTLLRYDPSRAKAMKEVWFAGVHSDIGGGYFCDGLGRLTLSYLWRCWNNAIAKDRLPKLKWQVKRAAGLTKTKGLPWLRHSETREGVEFLVEPRECTAANGGRPRVHPSVEKFVQLGGLQFCEEDSRAFPPRCTITPAVYTPVAYPGGSNVELYDSTSWS
jgi:hypothetical protein